MLIVKSTSVHEYTKELQTLPQYQNGCVIIISAHETCAQWSQCWLSATRKEQMQGKDPRKKELATYVLIETWKASLAYPNMISNSSNTLTFFNGHFFIKFSTAMLNWSLDMNYPQKRISAKGGLMRPRLSLLVGGLRKNMEHWNNHRRSLRYTPNKWFALIVLLNCLTSNFLHTHHTNSHSHCDGELLCRWPNQLGAQRRVLCLAKDTLTKDHRGRESN